MQTHFETPRNGFRLSSPVNTRRFFSSATVVVTRWLRQSSSESILRFSFPRRSFQERARLLKSMQELLSSLSINVGCYVWVFGKNKGKLQIDFIYGFLLGNIVKILTLLNIIHSNLLIDFYLLN